MTIVRSVPLFALALAALASAQIPDARPLPGNRTFTSAAVDAQIEALQPQFIDADLGQLWVSRRQTFAW